MQTIVDVNSRQAVKRWATKLAHDTAQQEYFNKFVGEGENNIIERKVELESDAGDEIRFDLSMRLRGDVTEGDNVVEGREESLNFYQDSVRIDQARKGVDAGGRMTRKRTLHDLRTIAKDRTAEYLAEWSDELKMVYLSGAAPGTYINQDSKVSRMFAGNPIQAPDPAHMVYAGGAVSKATLQDTHRMSRDLIELLATMPRMMNAIDVDTVKMSPVNINGKKKFVLVMAPWQTHALRTERGELTWGDIQKNAAVQNSSNPLFTDAVGELAGVVLHEHENVRRFTDYGAGSNVHAARALFLGRQAGVVAYGSAGNGTRMSWVEKLHDAESRVAIYAGTIMGFKKTRFNGRDFGVIAVDTACRNPGAAAA